MNRVVWLALLAGAWAAPRDAPGADPEAALWTRLPAKDGPAHPGSSSFADLIARARPAMVAVYTRGSRASHLARDGLLEETPQPWWMLPGAPEQGEVAGVGSGFVLRADGLILTNQHVVDGAERIQVLVFDLGRRLEARLVGADPRSDLALLRVRAPRALPVLPLGDSDSVRPGQWVLAIGNPLGLTQVVTKGIISGRGRALEDLSGGRAGFSDYLQTDAAIDRGSSGGPLINLRGEVIGINTAINNRARGIGFAVPVNLAKAVLPHLAHKGRLVRSYLGITVDELSWEVARSFGLESLRGVVVTEARPDLPAARAGLRIGDVLLAVAGVELVGRSDLAWRVATWPAGKTLPVTVWRQHERMTLEVVPVERPADRDSELPTGTRPDSPEADKPPDRLGLKVADVSPQVAQAAGLGSPVRGVVVMMAEGLAAEHGLRLGDVISDLNGQPVETVADLRRQLSVVSPGEMVRFYVLRQRSALFVALPKTWRD